MFDQIDASLLLHAGAVVYVIAFLFRDEALIRLFSVIGTLLYMGYYFWYPAEPLWDAIVTSTFFLGANVVVIFIILLERTTFGMSDEDKQLYGAFNGMTPGEFRKLLKPASWCQSDGDEMLTRAGEVSDHLFYIQEGTVTVSKGSSQFTLNAGRFVGEIGYMLGDPASGDTRAGKGTRYIAWAVADLNRIGRKTPAIANAMTAKVGRDLARKLRQSVIVGQ